MTKVLIETEFNDQVQQVCLPLKHVLLCEKLQQLMPELTDTNVVNALLMASFVNRPPKIELVLRNQPTIKAAINYDDWLLVVTNQANGKQTRFGIIQH